jgi:hypothetical protein
MHIEPGLAQADGNQSQRKDGAQARDEEGSDRPLTHGCMVQQQHHGGSGQQASDTRDRGERSREVELFECLECWPAPSARRAQEHSLIATRTMTDALCGNHPFAETCEDQDDAESDAQRGDDYVAQYC